MFDNLFDMGYAPIKYFVAGTRPNFVWSNPASACLAGSAIGTLNGQAIPVGSTPLLGNANLTGTFINCRTSSGDSLTGSANLNYSASIQTEQDIFSGISQINNFRTSIGLDGPSPSDLTGNGAVALLSTTKYSASKSIGSYVITPSAGSTLRNNLTGKTAQFVSGSSAYNDVSTLDGRVTEQTVEQRDMTFLSDGATYTSSGSYTTLLSQTDATSWSGQISLSRNGFQIGRIFGTSSGLYYEVNGVVHQWSAVQPQASSRGQPRSVR